MQCGYYHHSYLCGIVDSWDFMGPSKVYDYICFCLRVGSKMRNKCKSRKMKWEKFFLNLFALTSSAYARNVRQWRGTIEVCNITWRNFTGGDWFDKIFICSPNVLELFETLVLFNSIAIDIKSIVILCLISIWKVNKNTRWNEKYKQNGIWFERIESLFFILLDFIHVICAKCTINTHLSCSWICSPRDVSVWLNTESEFFCARRQENCIRT